MKFCREVLYEMQPFSCQHWEKHMSKQNYEISARYGREEGEGKVVQKRRGWKRARRRGGKSQMI